MKTLKAKAGKYVLCFTVGMLIIDLAAGGSAYLMEFSLCMCLLVTLKDVFFDRENRREKLGRAVKRISAYKAFMILLGAYIFMDIAELFYSPNPQTAILKYKAVPALAAWFGMAVIYTETIHDVNRICATAAAAACTAALLAVANYKCGFWPVYYTLRLTLRADYNVYATVLMFGWICGVFVIAQSRKLKLEAKTAASFALTSLLLPVIIFSSSRRIYYLIFPTIILLTVMLAVFDRDEEKKTFRRLAGCILCSAAGILACSLVTVMLSIMMNSNYRKNGAIGSLEAGGAAYKAQSRYQTVYESGVFTKRAKIWRIALEKYFSYSLRDKLLGKGAAFDIALYDMLPENTVRQIYPTSVVRGKLSAHNFIIADLLNGGAIKAVCGIICMLLLTSAVMRQQPLIKRILLISVFSIVLLNNLISNRFGVLYDRFFWIWLSLMFTAEKGGIADATEEFRYRDIDVSSSGKRYPYIQ